MVKGRKFENVQVSEGKVEVLLVGSARLTGFVQAQEILPMGMFLAQRWRCEGHDERTGRPSLKIPFRPCTFMLMNIAVRNLYTNWTAFLVEFAIINCIIDILRTSPAIACSLPGRRIG